MKETYDIDIVVAWVDGNDPEWQKEFNKYVPDLSHVIDVGEERYRDWDLLKYWFRGVEKFAPWVRKVHFVTSGQKPVWLNVNAPKLHWVKHEDFIPKEFLPTFSARPIELNFHRIEGLAEHFVYFNDDFFLINHTPRERFFQNGLPCDMALCHQISPLNNVLGHTIVNNMCCINETFNKREVMRKNFFKWFNPKYGAWQVMNWLLYPWSMFSYLYDFHLPYCHRKSIFEEVWAKYGDRLNKESMTRFRHITNCNQSLMRTWQLVKGEFTPYNITRDSKYWALTDDNLETVVDCVRQQKKNIIVINDNEDCNNFEESKQKLIDAFEHILPEKSSFEL